MRVCGAVFGGLGLVALPPILLSERAAAEWTPRLAQRDERPNRGRVASAFWRLGAAGAFPTVPVLGRLASLHGHWASTRSRGPVLTRPAGDLSTVVLLGAALGRRTVVAEAACVRIGGTMPFPFTASLFFQCRDRLVVEQPAQRVGQEQARRPGRARVIERANAELVERLEDRPRSRRRAMKRLLDFAGGRRAAVGEQDPDDGAAIVRRRLERDPRDDRQVVVGQLVATVDKRVPTGERESRLIARGGCSLIGVEKL
jgi:hypothetical protein